MPNTLRSRLGFFKNNLRKPSFWIILLTDIVLVAVAHICAYLIRFPDSFTASVARYPLASTIPMLVAIKIPIFYLFGLYRGMWRYTSFNDLFNIVKASVASLLVVVATLVFVHRFQGYPRSVFILDAILTFLLISGHRVLIRFFYQRIQGPRTLAAPAPREKKRLLLIGAGDAAEQIIRETRNNPALPYQVVGLVDDDAAKIGLKIHGITVLGLVDDLVEHCARIRADEILIAISSLTGEQVKRLNRLCRETRLEYKILPGLGEIIGGRVSIKAIRDISYKDLLGRAEVKLDQRDIGGFLTGKTVLVTGAGGSIGSELCRQIVPFQPERIILFDAGEENLYTIQMELVHEYDFAACEAVLGRVQDRGLLDAVFETHRPTVVFHAAAYKHVPLVELNPWEAVENNIVGTRVLAETAMMHGVERFVLVSTDKAVRPTNVMGASKRLAELIILAGNRDSRNRQTVFLAVRFGNVLGSSGSVIPLFKRQIELGGPVTITHPEITRYFMSIEEAARLIIQAGAMGRGGEIFILKMGEPVKIDKMARDLIRLAGREPDTEIEIKYIGLRPGEKLYEELITEGEGIVPTRHEKIMVLHGNGIDHENLESVIEDLRKNANNHDAPGIRQVLKKILPEYLPEPGAPTFSRQPGR